MSVVFLCVLLAAHVVLGDAAPPTPYGATPSKRQLKWHEREFYGFVHFTTNTFTDKEWGYGDESPATFSPTDFDADQIVLVAKQAGMNGLILTCKHHDGFCLWPSKYTDHSVKQSPWKEGKGDVVGEISAACRRHDVAFGIYLSPWDRHQAFYGQPEYIAYYRNQLTELLTDYGPVFEVWLDGANGGDGYYGGAREHRRIDRSRYYEWQGTFELIRALQPAAAIFSDAGPDVRWIGNERGFAGEPCWATLTPALKTNESVAAPGAIERESLLHGDRAGKDWIPAEADVSIRPGWFYHADEDAKVRSGRNIADLYFKSVGRGAALLLNLPPDRRGQIPSADKDSLVEFRRILDETFDENLLQQAELLCSNERGEEFGASKLLDGDKSTYWATADDVVEAEVIASFAKDTRFNVVDVRECLSLGQRVDHWTLSYWTGSEWEVFAVGESIGSRRLWHGETIEASKVRLSVSGPVCPAISEFGVYLGPSELQE